MTKTLLEVFERVKSWPEQDQEALAEYARELESERTLGVYVMTAEERSSVEEGLVQAHRGEYASDEEIEVMRKRFGSV